MAASLLSRLALQTTRLTGGVLRQQIFSVVPKQSFSVSTCIFGKKRYTEKHEWIKIQDGSNEGTVGISDHAQESLGEIVYVELPELGTTLEKDDSAGCLESVKAASEIYCPVAGTVTAVNSELADSPSLINKSPEDKGWLFKLDVANPDEVEELMDEGAYKSFLTEQE